MKNEKQREKRKRIRRRKKEERRQKRKEKKGGLKIVAVALAILFGGYSRPHQHHWVRSLVHRTVLGRKKWKWHCATCPATKWE